MIRRQLPPTVITRDLCVPSGGRCGGRCTRMSFEWEIVESGPKSAGQTVLLIPGGLNTSRSYAELMAQPALAGVRLIAVTLPGHGGTPPPRTSASRTTPGSLLTSPPASVVMSCSGSASAQASRSRWLRQERSPGRLSCWDLACRPGTSRVSSARSSGSAARWEACHQQRC